MKNASLTASRYVTEYEKLADRLGETLREYLGDPSEESTRNVRASVRRLDACLGIIPKKERSRATKRCRDRSKKLLKLTSRIRDIDILRAKLLVGAGDPTVDLILKNIAEEREEYVGETMQAAWKLFEVRGPKLAKKDASAVSSWLMRTLEELDEEIGEELPLVIKNEGRIDELHSLRKHAKRVRYTLELLSPSTRTSKVVERLKVWQDILGAIRDSDVAIEYLSRARQSAAVRELVVAERASRHKRYLAFVRSYNRGTGGRFESLIAAAGLKQSLR